MCLPAFLQRGCGSSSHTATAQAHTALLQPQLHPSASSLHQAQGNTAAVLGVGFCYWCYLVNLKLLLTRGVRAGCGEGHFPFRQESAQVQTSLIPAHWGAKMAEVGEDQQSGNEWVLSPCRLSSLSSSTRLIAREVGGLWKMISIWDKGITMSIEAWGLPSLAAATAQKFREKWRTV